jgi:hypothetical protein
MIWIKNKSRVVAETERTIQLKRLHADVESLDKLLRKERAQGYALQKRCDILDQTACLLRTDTRLQETQLQIIKPKSIA